MLATMPHDSSSARYAPQQYCTPRSEWWISERQLHCHRTRAGFRVAADGDAGKVDLFRYVAWLAHQLVSQEKDGKAIFDSVIVITDRRILDEQIRETIRKFAQVSAVIGAVGTGSDSKTKQLTRFLADGKKIIISTVQTLPFVLDEIGSDHRTVHLGKVEVKQAEAARRSPPTRNPWKA